jgi:hypothetical protein
VSSFDSRGVKRDRRVTAFRPRRGAGRDALTSRAAVASGSPALPRPRPPELGDAGRLGGATATALGAGPDGGSASTSWFADRQ